MSKDVVVSEAVHRDNSPLRVDREKSIVYDVKIAGLTSKNRRVYTEDAYRKALPLYEGATGNADHPANFHRSNPPSGVASDQVTERPWTDTFCQYKELYFKPGEGVFAKELRCNPDHPATKPFLWLAEHAPHKVVLSQVVTIREPKRRDAKGNVIIDEIVAVNSVDVIGSNGGTNRTLYEGHTPVNELEQLGQSIKDMFPSDTGFSDVKTAVAKALKVATEIPTAFTGTVAEALSAMSATPDPRVRVIVEELDRRNAADAARERLEKAKKACTDAKLPETVVSEVFLGTLTRADENDWKALIDDRRATAVPTRSNPPKSSDGQGTQMTLDNLIANVKANR